MYVFQADCLALKTPSGGSLPLPLPAETGNTANYSLIVKSWL